MTKKVLIVATSHDKLGDTNEATGCWAEEIMAPYLTFKKHGLEVVLASTKGGKIPIDAASLAAPYLTKEVEEFQKDGACMKAVAESVAIGDIKSGSEVDAIFLAGGHGTCWDFPENQKLISLLEEAWKAGKVVSSVCHGVGGLVNVKDEHGKPLVAGKKLTGFSDSEEVAVAKDKLIPFLLETKLRSLGADYKAGADWSDHAIRDGRLITGQNPSSSGSAAQLIVEALSS